MSAADALNLAHTYRDSLQDLWKTYLTVAFAVLGFVTSAHKFLSRERGGFVAAAFAVFAGANLWSLLMVSSQQLALSDGTKKVLSNAGLDWNAFSPGSPIWIAVFHLVVDVFLIGIIIQLTRNLRLEKDLIRR